MTWNISQINSAKHKTVRGLSMRKCYWNDERIKALIFDSMIALDIKRMPTSRELFDLDEVGKTVPFYDPEIADYTGRQPDKQIKGANVDQLINRFGGYTVLANKYKLLRVDSWGRIIYPTSEEE